MTPERWAQIKEIFDAAVSLAPVRREEYVREACGADEALLGEIMQLFQGAPTQTLELAGLPRERILRVGEVLCERYRIERRIGKGGMGDVFEAMDGELGDRVAIKTVVQGKVDEDSFERLRRELRLTRRLTHPNICRVFDIARDTTAAGSVLFFTMELLAGETIHERLQKRGPMGEEEALELLRQVAGALEAAHSAGVVHRDLKPANIMLVPKEDGGTRAVVMDFGIARTLESGTVAAPFATMTGNLIGTPAYMAPEQLEGEAATPATDVYALGLILFEMLTGRRAFTDENTLAGALKRLHTMPERPSAYVPGLSAGWERAVLRCLEREPKARYGRAGEIVEAVEAGRARRARRVWPRRVAAGVLAVGLLAAGGWMARGWMERRSENQRRVAVLPFAGKGGVDEYVAAGFSGNVGDRLAAAAKGSSLGWVTSSELLQQGAREAGEARKKLGVNETITGDLESRADGYGVRLSINRAGDGGTPERIDMEAAKLPELAGMVTQRLARVYGLREGEVNARENTPEGVLRGLGLLPAQAEKAAAAFAESLKMEGETVEAYLGLARAQRLLLVRTKDEERGRQAEEALQKALRLAPADPRVSIQQAELLLAQRNPKAALERLEAAKLAGTDTAEAALAFAAAYGQMGLAEQAEAAFREAIRKDVHSWSAHNRLAVFYSNRGRYEDAANQFREALRIAPDNAQVLSNLGGVLLNLGRFEESRQHLERAARLQPTVAVMINLGSLSVKQKEWAAAAGWYEKALEKDGSDHKIWESLAKVYERLPGQKDKSRDAFLRALTEARKRLAGQANDPALLADVAAYQAFTGTRRDALESIQRALALGPSNVDVMMVAAEVYEALGFRTEALDWVKRAMERGFPRRAVEESLGLEELRKDSRFGR